MKTGGSIRCLWVCDILAVILGYFCMRQTTEQRNHHDPLMLQKDEKVTTAVAYSS